MSGARESPRVRGAARAALLGGALACLPLAGACVQVRLDRDTRLEPLPEHAVASLAPGEADLAAALALLGPPLYAWELPDDGVALAWGWFRSGGWQLRLSLPDTGHGESLYVDYARETERMRGAVLVFDARLVLVAAREGMLRDLRVAPRPRPAAVEPESGS